jgi:nucleoside-diphosphate-sugar epimerase
MQLLTFAGGPAAGQRVILLFGCGLVGGSLADHLVQAGARAQLVPLCWTDRGLQRRQLKALEAHLTKRAERCSHLAFFWSAGTAGFGADHRQAASELENFQEVVGFCGRAAELLRAGSTTFYLASSAGGLFEGQRSVDRSSTPRPRREYGWLKLEQEQFLADRSFPWRRRVLRLSSVYGPPRRGARVGLINALVVNGLQGAPTTIFGRLDTLRDFVWAGDIARFVARELLGGPCSEEESRFLVSTRPCSIHEIIHLVETRLGRRVPVQFRSFAKNDQDITFSPRSRPAFWEVSDLATQIAGLCRLGRAG